jgi:predicted MFS family arabinose efflux permease
LQDEKDCPRLQNGNQPFSISLSEKAPSSNVEDGGVCGSVPNCPNAHSHQGFSLTSIDAVNSISQSQRNESSSDKPNKQKVIDFSQLKKPLFQMFLFVSCLGNVASVYGHVYISPFARDHGISNSDISVLISVTNFCDFIGRLLCGVIANQRLIKNSTLVAVSQIITGGILALCSFYGPFWSFIVLAVVYGLFSGFLFALTPDLVADFVGMENFRTAYGILILTHGVAMGGGAPFLGESFSYSSKFVILLTFSHKITF